MPESNPLDRTFLRKRVQRLRAAIYARTDPTADPELLEELAQAEKQLREANTPVAAPEATSPPPVTPGRMLGPESTGLKVEPVLTMNPIPTAIYPMLDPETDPLLTVTVTNLSLDAKTRRVRVRAWLEGLSAEAVRTIEIKKGKAAPPLKLLPLLFPEMRPLDHDCPANDLAPASR